MRTVSQRKKLFLIIGILIIASLAWLVMNGHILILGLNESSDGIITGKVINVTDRVNTAENGYYGFTVQDKDGNRFGVNATGMLNSPPTPGGDSQTCLKVPHVRVGQTVSFSLPQEAIAIEPPQFTTCYPRDSPAHYFVATGFSKLRFAR